MAYVENIDIFINIAKDNLENINIELPGGDELTVGVGYTLNGRDELTGREWFRTAVDRFALHLEQIRMCSRN